MTATSRMLGLVGGALALLLAAVCVEADNVNPWEVTVPVADRSDAARRSALDEALAQVLVKLTGSAASAALGQGVAAPPMVQQFRYVDEVDADGNATSALRVTFVPSAVQGLVARSGTRIWPLERGTTAVWVAVEEQGRRRLLGLGDGDEVARGRLEEAAARRSLPVVLPLLDLEDQMVISAAEIWGGFTDRVRTASARYGAVQYLSGRIALERDVLTARWVLDTGAQMQRWQASGANLEELLVAAADEAAERLSAEYGVMIDAIAGAGSGIVVEGVSDYRDYGRLLRYLDDLSVVEWVAVREISGARMRLEFGLIGDAAALDRAISLGQVLVAEPSRIEATPTYRFMGSNAAARALPPYEQ